MDRTCGECTLCCTLLTVQETTVVGGRGSSSKTEFNKPAGSRCQYLCDKGCSIYPTRPYACRRFECLWLKGEAPDWARPDNIGVIFDEMKPKITGKRMPLLVIEEFSGAHKQKLVRPLIEELGKDREVLVVGRDQFAKTYEPEEA